MLGSDIMSYNITINDFEGPMDLLLHLIKKSDIDICDIKIEEITKQYLDFINEMERLDLNIASEYLTMAAELIEIKSSMLLPKKNTEEVEEEEDPRELLIKRLIEYKQYKELTSTFQELEKERKKIFTKLPDNLDEFKQENEKLNFGDIDLNDLMNAFEKFLERKKKEEPLNTKITKREYSVGARSTEIKGILKKKKKVEFEELFEVFTKDYVVVTFLSILSLARKQELKIEQEDNFGKIIISECLEGSE